MYKVEKYSGPFLIFEFLGKFLIRKTDIPDIGDSIRRWQRTTKIAIAALAHLAIFADHCDRRLKSPGVSPA